MSSTWTSSMLPNTTSTADTISNDDTMDLYALFASDPALMHMLTDSSSLLHLPPPRSPSPPPYPNIHHSHGVKKEERPPSPLFPPEFLLPLDPIPSKSLPELKRTGSRHALKSELDPWFGSHSVSVDVFHPVVTPDSDRYQPFGQDHARDNGLGITWPNTAPLLSSSHDVQLPRSTRAESGLDTGASVMMEPTVLFDNKDKVYLEQFLRMFNAEVSKTANNHSITYSPISPETASFAAGQQQHRHHFSEDLHVHGHAARSRKRSADMYHALDHAFMMQEGTAVSPPPLGRRKTDAFLTTVAADTMDPRGVNTKFPLDWITTEISTSSKLATNARNNISVAIIDETTATSSDSAPSKKSSTALTDEQKRNNHILSEKRRRIAIKNAYDRVQDLVPKLREIKEAKGVAPNGLCRGLSKAQIVEHCEVYVKALRQEVVDKTELCRSLEQRLEQRNMVLRQTL